mmetsp:Transcript_41994/g.132377  ORF Transcript_41994/g.132377 Transcript_41994/m.132377 type:complete len:205 (+) Transcript_41994:122-736(+)
MSISFELIICFRPVSFLLLCISLASKEAANVCMEALPSSGKRIRWSFVGILSLLGGFFKLKRLDDLFYLSKSTLQLCYLFMHFNLFGARLFLNLLGLFLADFPIPLLQINLNICAVHFCICISQRLMPRSRFSEHQVGAHRNHGVLAGASDRQFLLLEARLHAVHHQRNDLLQQPHAQPSKEKSHDQSEQPLNVGERQLNGAPS